MDRKRLKQLMSILTAMAIISMSFTGAFSVAAEELDVISESDVTEAILYNHADGAETPENVVGDDYDVTSSLNEEGKIEVAITATDVKLHKNAGETMGYWVGFAVIAPDGATHAEGTFGADSYQDETVISINGAGDRGVAFYVNAGASEPKTEATLQWFDEEGAISEVETFVIDLTGVTLYFDTAPTPAVTTAIIADSADADRTVYNTYTAVLDGTTVDIGMTKLALHKNGNGEEGYWTGFAVVAPECADFVKYSFGETENGYIPVETAVATVEDEEKDGIAFYTDAANPNTEVKLQWFDGENIALSNPVELTMNLEDVEYYQINAEDVTEAVLKDTSETPKETLYTDYSVEAVTNDGTIAVTVTAADLEKHENGNDTPGYWTGFAVEAPERAEKMRYAFGATDELSLGTIEAVHTIAENKTGIAFYVNAGTAAPKTYAKLQWFDAEENALTAEMNFVIDLSNVTLSFDYTPAIAKAKIQDSANPEKGIYETYDVTQSTNEDGAILVDITMTELAEHKNGSGDKGYWTGFAIEAPEDANKVKVAFDTAENIDWNNAAMYGVETNVVDEKSGAAFYTNAADDNPKTVAMLQWFKDEEALSNVITFEMNLENVKLNWIKKDTVTLAPTTGTVTGAEIVTAQIDDVITVKYAAENLDKHANGEGAEGYWIGFAVEAPAPEAKANVTFGDYSNASMELEEINSEKKGVTFYTNAGNANPKTEATLQWVDAEGNPLSAPTEFVIDISAVTLAELPYIIADDVKEAKIVDQSNTSVKPYSSYSVSAEENGNGIIVVDIYMKSLKSHKNSDDKAGYWTGFAVVAPQGAVTLRYAFATEKDSLSMSTAAVETGVVAVDEVEKNGAAFYTNAGSLPKKYVRLQWFDENGEAITNATDFEMNLGGVKLYSKRSGARGGSSLSNYTVKFETDGGSAVASVKVKKEETISEPAAPVKDGYVFEGWYTDKELTQKYDFSAVVTKSFTLYAKWKEKAMSFTDVKSNAWYYETVKEVVSLGLMNGISETEFAPELSVTRAMFVTVLYRTAGQPKIESAVSFNDVAAGQYYADAVAWANSNGIVNGVSETEFASETNITREQMAAILYRYAQAAGAKEAAADEITYTDKDSISDYAAEAIAWAKASGIMEGNEDGTFAPARNASRAEAAAVFVRLINFLK